MTGTYRAEYNGEVVEFKLTLGEPAMQLQLRLSQQLGLDLDEQLVSGFYLDTWAPLVPFFLLPLLPPRPEPYQCIVCGSREFCPPSQASPLGIRALPVQPAANSCTSGSFPANLPLSTLVDLYACQDPAELSPVQLGTAHAFCDSLSSWGFAAVTMDTCTAELVANTATLSSVFFSCR